MEIIVAGLLFGVLGAAFGRLHGQSSMRSASAALEERSRQLTLRVSELVSERETLIDQLDDARQVAAVAEADLAHAKVRAKEREADDQRLLGEFERLSRATLTTTSQDLVKAAEASFSLAQEVARGERNQERSRIEHMVGPVQENLAKLEQYLQGAERERKAEYGGLFQQMTEVAQASARIQQEASALKNVLKSSTSARGRWGEVQLRRVVELAGMCEHADFSEQTTVSDSEGIVRADLVVYLPGDLKIAVDAKVPYGAYEQAQSTEDPVAQNRFLADHAKQFRAHIDTLAKREYWERYLPSTGFSVLFVPGEALLDAALRQEPALWERAAEKHILLATPSTLIALLRMAALGWRQDAQAENAIEITRVGRELYKRLVKAGTDVEKMGKAMSSAMSTYNSFIGTLDGRVLPQAKRLADLGAGDHSMPKLIELEESPRDLQTRSANAWLEDGQRPAFAADLDENEDPAAGNEDNALFAEVPKG